MLQTAAERVEEALFEVAVHRERNEVVGARDGRVVAAARLRATLVLILKAGETGQVRRDRDVALVAGLIAIVNVLRAERAAIEDRLSRGGVAVGAGDGDGVAEGSGPKQ